MDHQTGMMLIKAFAAAFAAFQFSVTAAVLLNHAAT